MFLLKDKTEIIFYRNKIQENIDFFRTNKGEKQLDYALTGEYRIGNNEVNKEVLGSDPIKIKRNRKKCLKY